MEKIWLHEYPKDIPHHIQTQHHSIVGAFEEAVKKYHNKIAFENFSQKLSFHQWKELSDHWASYLKNELKLKKGDRIAIQLPNILQFPIAVMGALKAGLVVVNINPLYTAKELNNILKDAQVQALLVFSHSAHKLHQLDVKVPHIIVTHLEDLFSPIKRFLFFIIIRCIKRMVKPYPPAESFLSALDKGRLKPFKEEKLQPEDIAFLQYTGGTTGVQKGAILSHKNILSNWRQCLAWMSPYLKEGEEISIAPLPLYHIFALMLNLIVLPFYGTHTVLITNPRDTRSFIKTLKNINNFTNFIGVNALFKLLLNEKKFKKINFQSLKTVIAGGAAVETAVAQLWHQITDSPLIEGYGLTEASPVVSCNILDSPVPKSCGLPFPSTDIRIVDSQGQELSWNQPGELQVKGPQVMVGYWNKPSETQNVLSKDGWLKTGDIAQVNEKGYIQIVDRKKDMILVSGFNVFPNEIEDVISLHPKVRSTAVIGVPDPHSSEVPKAFIVKKDPSLTKEEVLDFCKKHLTGYKVPKHIEFMDSLPLSNVGKVLRRKLR